MEPASRSQPAINDTYALLYLPCSTHYRTGTLPTHPRRRIDPDPVLYRKTTERTLPKQKFVDNAHLLRKRAQQCDFNRINLFSRDAGNVTNPSHHSLYRRVCGLCRLVLVEGTRRQAHSEREPNGQPFQHHRHHVLGEGGNKSAQLIRSNKRICFEEKRQAKGGQTRSL